LTTCSSCAAEVDEGAQFCPSCGSAMKATLAATDGETVPLVVPEVALAGSTGNVVAATPRVAGTIATAPPASVPQTVVNVTNTVATSSPTVVVMNANNGPGFLVRAVWFVFVGWWLSFLWIGFAWFLNLTILGLPLGLMMINRVPAVLTLQASKKETRVTTVNGVTMVETVSASQLPMWIRAVYFVVVGWWASLAFAIVAWGLSVLILTLPLGLLMFNYLPQVTTLRKN